MWGTRGRLANGVTRVSDDVEVRAISTLLEPAGRVSGHPVRLAENEGIAFQGCIVLGMGFVLEPEEAAAWIEAEPRNADVLFPYMNGEDLNSRPDTSAARWVIDFTGYCEQCAARYALPYGRLVETVKGERARNNRKVYRDDWWLFAERRPALRRATADLDEVLAIALVSKTVMPARVPTGQVFSHKTAVFATSAFEDLAVLSSSLHLTWAITYSSTLETRVNYSPSDVFLTFPRPGPTEALETLGRALDAERREIMLRRDLGLTKLYNLINDPGVSDGSDGDVARLRRIHVDIDHAVMEAYGWGDVSLDHGFYVYRQMERWTVSPAARVEILDLLLAENHRRAAAQDEAPKPGGAPGHDTGPHLPGSGELGLFTKEHNLDEEGD